MIDATTETTDDGFDLVILGASGDLTTRLLLPGLGSLMAVRTGLRPRILGVASSDLAIDDWRETVRDALAAAGPDRAARAADDADYRACDLLDASSVDDLARVIRPRSVLYFALPASVTERLVVLLAAAGLPDDVRIALEKPIGDDEASARALNEAVARLVPEHRVFRVDHFLGKSLVLNILGMRFSNRIVEPLWNNLHVERVEIVYDEPLTVEGRGSFYDRTGALVDMLQSHLLLVAAIVAMEEPSELHHGEFRDLVAHALRAMRLWGDDPRGSSRRARYTAGAISDRAVPDYVDEPGVDAARRTETLAEAAFEVASQRWAGVPFVLRSGKALGDARRIVLIRFRDVPLVPRGIGGEPVTNVLEFDLATGGISLRLATLGDDTDRLEPTVLRATVDHADALEPYGEVLERLIDGDPMLSVRDDVTERCWAILQPIIDAWRADAVPLDEYVAGSDGPAAWKPLAAPPQQR